MTVVNALTCDQSGCTASIVIGPAVELPEGWGWYDLDLNDGNGRTRVTLCPNHSPAFAKAVQSLAPFIPKPEQPTST